MVAIKDMKMPSSCYDCPFVKNEITNDYGSFCECGILEDYETINLLEHSKHPNCPLVEQEPKRGHWIPTYGNVKCSVCGSVKDSREVGRATHYCDFCGAKMESEE